MSESENPAQPRLIPARASRAAARYFNYGNLVAVLLPVPLGILWFGASMVVYAMNRHHPNPRVGHYTQHAAYRFYGVVGFVVAIGAFFATGLKTWLITWAIVALILLPWTVWDLWQIQQEDWQDTTYSNEEHPT
jgi:hypothetical protein